MEAAEDARRGLDRFDERRSPWSMVRLNCSLWGLGTASDSAERLLWMRTEGGRLEKFEVVGERDVALSSIVLGRL